MTEFQRSGDQGKRPATGDVPVVSVQASHTIDWYAEGDARTVDIGGVEVIVRFVGRKGRRARIAISAPPGVVFRDGGDIRQMKVPDCGRRDES